MIVALSALLALAAPASACPIPAHGAVVQANAITSQSIVIFDLATGDETCEIDVPGYPLSVAVGANGMLYVAREPSKMTDLTTDPSPCGSRLALCARASPCGSRLALCARTSP